MNLQLANQKASSSWELLLTCFGLSPRVDDQSKEFPILTPTSRLRSTFLVILAEIRNSIQLSCTCIEEFLANFVGDVGLVLVNNSMWLWAILAQNCLGNWFQLEFHMRTTTIQRLKFNGKIASCCFYCHSMFILWQPRDMQFTYHFLWRWSRIDFKHQSWFPPLFYGLPIKHHRKHRAMSESHDYRKDEWNYWWK